MRSPSAIKVLLLVQDVQKALRFLKKEYAIVKKYLSSRYKKVMACTRSEVMDEKKEEKKEEKKKEEEEKKEEK